MFKITVGRKDLKGTQYNNIKDWNEAEKMAKKVQRLPEVHGYKEINIEKQKGKTPKR